MKDFRNKVIVITGAASGIGRATALAFAREGAKLHLTDINRERIEAVAAEVRALRAEATAYVVDSSDRAAMEKFAADVYTNAGRVDVLHNNAGIGAGARFEEISLEHWERIIAVNLWGVIHGIHFFLPRMIAQGGGGHIVNTASGAGLCGLPGLGHYTATKFAVVGLSEVMNMELQRHGIFTTALCPGIINTNIIQESLFQETDEAQQKKNQAVSFYDRFGAGPEGVARDVLKAVRKRRAVQVSPGFHLYPIWYCKRLSVGLYQALGRMAAKKLV
jgi:NAD(P)-dependent dehydrogenase (short-subunit alcohol dehydrogenase family)